MSYPRGDDAICVTRGVVSRITMKSTRSGYNVDGLEYICQIKVNSKCARCLLSSTGLKNPKEFWIKKLKVIVRITGCAIWKLLIKSFQRFNLIFLNEF